MDVEKTKDFNKRLSEWVASQGFWFQVRYSMISSGTGGRAMFHFIRMAFRLMVFLVILAVIGWVVLWKHRESKAFADGIRDQVTSGLRANDVDLRGVLHSRGQLEIARLAAEGGNGTFFKSIEASTIRCNMSLIDGLVRGWNPGVISIANLDMILIAGADDEESAGELAEVFFGKSNQVEINTVEVAEANLSWGFTNRTQGSIESSWMRAQRIHDGWRIIFKGGTFSQNWFHNLEIQKLVVLCKPDGIVFETALFTQGKGSVDFSGLEIAAGARPRVDGLLKAKHMDLQSMLPEAAHGFVEGRISGDFKVSGSPNSAEGVGFEGEVVLDDGDIVTLRDEIHILKALSVMDYSRNYHKVDLIKGGFKLKTTNGGMVLEDVDLEAAGVFTLQGGMRVRLPTQREIRAAIAKREAGRGNRLFETPPEDKSKIEDDSKDLTLELDNQTKDPTEFISEVRPQEEDPTLYDRLNLYQEMRMLELQAASEMTSMLKCVGKFHITIPSNAFERAAQLQEIYPVDSETNRIPIEVTIEGDLADITLEQAEDLYEKGKR